MDNILDHSYEREQQNPEFYGYASFGQRFVASFLDGVIIGVANFVITLPLTMLNLEDLGSIVQLVIGIAYVVYFEAGEKQATIGKQAMGIKVTNLDGERISQGQAIGRYLGKILSTIILFIGFLMMLFTERKQTLHDMMASCLVVKARP